MNNCLVHAEVICRYSVLYYIRWNYIIVEDQMFSTKNFDKICSISVYYLYETTLKPQALKHLQKPCANKNI